MSHSISHLSACLQRLRPQSERTTLAAKNISASLLLKCLNILISLVIVPLTIDYISVEQYGIWITLSTVVAWLAYFDIGFGNGFRFRFTEAVARKDFGMAQRYVSTTYALLTILFLALGAAALGVNEFLDWTALLKVSAGLRDELRITFALLLAFFCLTFVLQTLTTMLTADQRPALASAIQLVGQAVALVGIYLLANYAEASMALLVVCYSGLPCLVLFVASFVLFHTRRYKPVSPKWKSIDFRLSKDILNMGVKYFFTTSALFVILQFVNFIITRHLGPEAVTQYNIAFRYYNVLLMAFIILITPFWSAFTDAYTQHDFAWMKGIVRKLEYAFIVFLAGSMLMVVVSPLAFTLWIGESVSIPLALSIGMCVMVNSQLLTSLYIYPINGTGKMMIQIVVDVCFALVAIPALIYSCDYWGLLGVLGVLTIFHVTLAAFCRRQLYLIINQKAHGLWNK